MYLTIKPKTLNSDSIQELRGTIEQSIPCSLIIDFKNISHIDEVGIGFLVYCHSRCENIIARNLSTDIERVLKLAGAYFMLICE